MADSSNQELNLEVGAGGSPLIHLLRKDLLGPGGAVLLDMQAKQMKGLKDESEVIFGQKFMPVAADITNMPLKDHSCGTILAVNVVSQGVGNIDLDVGRVTKMANSLSNKIIDGGKLILLDTYSPTLLPKERTIEIFTKAGFSVSEQYEKNKINEIFAPESRKRAIVDLMTIGPDAKYSIVFEKQK